MCSQSQSSQDWNQFFSENPAPANFSVSEEKMANFVSSNQTMPLCLVTSGGTTVPLEINTVRFVDNFSAGTRGSASAEYFLKNGFAVIFLHREKSLKPFARHFSTCDLLTAMEVEDEGNISIAGDTSIAKHLKPVVENVKKYQNNLCKVSFTSLSDYLWLLRSASQQLATTAEDNPSVHRLLYLAAAVSDFYIPAIQLPEHKIQSSQGAPQVQLQLGRLAEIIILYFQLLVPVLVPKMLKPLVSLWASNCFVVSFKLETDPDILISKSRSALETYGHNLVIGNILVTRKRKVVMVTKEGSEEIVIDDEELKSGFEIEEKIVKKLVEICEKL